MCVCVPAAVLIRLVSLVWFPIGDLGCGLGMGGSVPECMLGCGHGAEVLVHGHRCRHWAEVLVCRYGCGHGTDVLKAGVGVGVGEGTDVMPLWQETGNNN